MSSSSFVLSSLTTRDRTSSGTCEGSGCGFGRSIISPGIVKVLWGLSALGEGEGEGVRRADIWSSEAISDSLARWREQLEKCGCLRLVLAVLGYLTSRVGYLIRMRCRRALVGSITSPYSRNTRMSYIITLQHLPTCRQLCCPKAPAKTSSWLLEYALIRQTPHTLSDRYQYPLQRGC